ncbi:MAG: DUF72 domain-containing protein [Bdellovibrionota bacterium]
MEFGKLDNVDQVDWALPKDDPLSAPFLAQFQKNDPLKVYFGAPAWNHKEWMGKIYPLKTKPTEFLYHYSRYFTCLEMNTVHYRIPTGEQVKKWRDKVPEEFLFCPKVFNGLSHTCNGLRDKQLLSEWMGFLESLQSNCGPSFLQLPPQYDYSNRAELFEFLKNWPVHFELSLEFRHPSWFQEGRILPLLTQYLQTRKIGLVITDVAGRRDVLHTSMSADFSMVRFIGNALHPSDYTRTDTWLERFRIWEGYGLQRVFLFIHEPDDILVPEMTSSIVGKVRSAGFVI